jgi:hypothetical protein
MRVATTSAIYFIQAFRNAADIFVTRSKWWMASWEEVQGMDGWINRFESFGFRYSQSVTETIREIAKEEHGEKNTLVLMETLTMGNMCGST